MKSHADRYVISGGYPALIMGVLVGLLSIRPVSLAQEMSDASLQQLSNTPVVTLVAPYIYAATAAMLLLYALLKIQSHDCAVRIAVPLLLFILFHVAKLLRVIGTYSAGISEIAMFATPVMICGLCSISSNQEKVLSLLIAAFVFACLNTYGTLASDAGLWQGRALGVTAHPNHLGHLSALFALICIASRKAVDGRVTNGVLGMTILALVALCVASGSRSGWLVLGTGICVFAFLNKSFAVLVFVAVCGVSLFALQGYGSILGIAPAAEHFERGNTRAEVVGILLDHIEQAPFFGVGVLEDSATSNAWLSAWAHYGIITLGLLIATYSAAETIALKRFRVQPVLLLVATVVPALCVSALFEGQVLDRYSPMLFIQGLVLSFYVVYSPAEVTTERKYTGNNSVQRS